MNSSLDDFIDISDKIILVVDIISIPLYILILILFLFDYSINTVSIINIEITIICLIYSIGIILAIEPLKKNCRFFICIDEYCDLSLVSLLTSFIVMSCLSMNSSFEKYKKILSSLLHIMCFIFPIIFVIVIILIYDKGKEDTYCTNTPKGVLISTFVIECIYYLIYMFFWVKLKQKLKKLQEECQDIFTNKSYITKLRMCFIVFILFVFYIVISLINVIISKKNKDLVKVVLCIQSIISAFVPIFIVFTLGFDKTRMHRLINKCKNKKTHGMSQYEEEMFDKEFDKDFLNDMRNDL